MTSLESERHEPPQGNVTRHHHPSHTNVMHGKPTTPTTLLDATSPTKSPTTTTVLSKMKKILEPQVTLIIKAKPHTALHRRSKPRPFNSRTVYAKAKTRNWRS